MKNALLCAALGTFAAACVLPAMAADHRLAFDGGIGSQPFASVGGVVAANDVRGIAPGGRPWVIGKLRAVVRQDGALTVKGSGLLLAGGSNVGLPAVPRQDRGGCHAAFGQAAQRRLELGHGIAGAKLAQMPARSL